MPPLNRQEVIKTVCEKYNVHWRLNLEPLTPIGEPLQQDRAGAVQGGGCHLEDPAASQHLEAVRLLGGDTEGRQEGQEGPHPHHGAHDLRNPQGVSHRFIPSGLPSL